MIYFIDTYTSNSSLIFINLINFVKKYRNLTLIIEVIDQFSFDSLNDFLNILYMIKLKLELKNYNFNIEFIYDKNELVDIINKFNKEFH